MDQLGLSWNREGLALENEIAEESPLPLNLSITDYRPEQEGASELTQWMADFGLLGDRPGNELLKNSVSEQLFTLLLNTGNPISLDDAHEQFGGQKARLGRILERFRACGLVERIPRTDRLGSALWSAMVTQHQRRGEDWLLKKGGFMRLIPEKNHNALLQPLSKGKLTIEMVQNSMQNIRARIKCFCSIFSADGYRWVTDSSVLQLMIQNRTSLPTRPIVTKNPTSRHDDEEVLTTGDER